MMALICSGGIVSGGVARAADEPIPVAQAAPMPSVPAGWVWQGVWQDGRWSGQWVPGPGVPGPGTPGPAMSGPGMMPSPGMMPPPPGVGAPCHHDHHAARGCDAVPPAPSAYPPMPYGPAPYGSMPSGPMMMGWTWMPVPMQAPQPCVETRTTTVTYVEDHRRRVIAPRPHHHDKRVYTGS